VALAVGVVHRREQVGPPGQLELDYGQCQADWRSKTLENIMSHSDNDGQKAFVVRLLASCNGSSPARRPARHRRKR
jgi:hypothetical protein